MKDFLEEEFPMQRNTAESKKVITSFGCYVNSDAIVTLINANVHYHLRQLWRVFFQIFVNGDVFYAQTWEVLTLKNSIEPP